MRLRVSLHVLSCLLFAIRNDVLAVHKLVGRVGEQLGFICIHEFASTNIKYLCRGSCSGLEVLIRSTGVKKTTQKGRYSLYDRGGGRFTVTIAGLQRSDAGTYWCGVERSGLDTFQEIYIKVLDAPPVTHPPLPDTTNSMISNEGRLNYIPPCVFAGLLILGVSLMLYHYWNIRSILRASPSSRGETNTAPAETTPEDENPDRMSQIYQNLEPSITTSNPVYETLHREIKSNFVYNSLVSKGSQ